MGNVNKLAINQSTKPAGLHIVLLSIVWVHVVVIIVIVAVAVATSAATIAVHLFIEATSE